MEIHRQLVSGARVKFRKKVRMCCSAVDSGRTDVDDKQRPGRPNTSSTYDSVHMHLEERMGAFSSRTSLES